jgi:hypothetical protein
MSESTLTNLDGIPQYTPADTHLYHTSMIRPTNADNTSKSMTIIVQNPFDDSSHSFKYHHDTSFHQTPESHNLIAQHPVRFNQELLDNFGISVPLSKQAGTADHQSTTSLIPIPSPLSNNLGINLHSMNQPSLTPTMIGTYPTQSYTHFDNHHQQQTPPPGIYLNNPRSMIGKLNQQPRPTNGISPIISRYPATQQYGHQMIKPRMIPPNVYGTSPQVIMSQQTPIIYDPNTIYRINGQQTHHLPPDDNILKSLLQINPQMNPEIALKSRTTDQPPLNVPKSRKKRKANDLNTSFEDDQPTKSRKRKKKGTEGTDKFVEYSLQQLRDLPMLTPLEPLIDNKDDVSFHMSEKKSNYQGEFGNVFIENIHDYYRPNRRAPPPIILPNSLSLHDRRYRLCSNLLDRPPSLPSPPLFTNASEKLFELTTDKTVLHGDESIISTSTSADDDHLITDNIHLLQTLSSSYDNDLRPLSPVITADETTIEKNEQSIVDGPDKVSVTLTLTTEAANNVQSVIAAVTDLLKIAYPTTFDVHQSLNNNNCTCSSIVNNSQSKDLLSLNPSSQISNINRVASSIYKIGRETSVNIQTLIDIQPKYCRNCSQNLTAENLFKKRLNELPVNLRELTSNAEPFIYFCSELCFTAYSQQQQQTVIKTEPLDVTTSILKRQDQIIDNKHWKRWDPNLSVRTYIPPSNTDEVDQLINDIKISLSPNAKQDKRVCVFCNGIGDMTSNGPGRLLNLDVGQWCHLNCALWSSEVYETRCGALMCVEQAFSRSIHTECVICKQKGSSLSCFYQRCSNKYHFTCAIEHGCVFYKNKTIMCPIHALKSIANDEIMEDKSVVRKIWINRDEIKQIQDYMNDEQHDDKSYILRIGSLILHNIGQLLPHQLQSSVFHNRDFIYPIGYTVTRFYWSMHHPNHRCAYICSIIDIDNKPMFRIRVQDNEQIEEYCDVTAKGAWQKIINEIDLLRRKHGLVKMFSVYITGEDLFGLTVKQRILFRKKKNKNISFRNHI